MKLLTLISLTIVFFISMDVNASEENIRYVSVSMEFSERILEDVKTKRLPQKSYDINGTNVIEFAIGDVVCYYFDKEVQADANFCIVPTTA